MSTILAFESSCDETAVALLEFSKAGDFNTYKYTHKLNSQIALHAEYGGVVPELASRDHVRNIKPLAEEVLAISNKQWNEINYFAYTAGPGLAGALMVAGGFVSALAIALQKPIIPVHHLEGHLLSPLLANPHPPFPYIALLISGGHSQIYKVTNPTDYHLLGESIDDAAGEAFDKTAKLLGLPYPGGQYLEKMSLEYQPTQNNNHLSHKKLPRPMINSKNLQMSFSGLKTAVWHWVREVTIADKEKLYPQIAYEFQQAIVEVLITKALQACSETGIKTLCVCGGVAKNKVLKNNFEKHATNKNINLFFTPFEYCTDNAVMIALAASFYLNTAKITDGGFKVKPHFPLSLKSTI